ncbi:hypothetical protein [Flavobacterium sp.]|uniref:hypothetical protein n=1 Tax=Flavobacterium sp. TaxID=239 RepID=UPI0035298233
MKTKSYFFQSFFALVLATASFFLFKTFLRAKLFPETKTATKNVVVDSLLLDAINEEKTTRVDTFDIQIKNNTILTTTTDSLQAASVFIDDEHYTGINYLTNFFSSLFQLETNKQGSVRIAYFSDSMTDGDMIVQDIRTLFQEKFGGNGVGFVNITSESAASRSSVWHTFSTNWTTQSYLKTKKPKQSFGINGHVFFANDTIPNSWVKYTASKMRYVTELPKPTLFYGKPTSKNTKIYSVVGNDTLNYNLLGNQQLNTLQLTNNNLKSLKVYFDTHNTPIYGFNFDDGKGVHIDNFSSRGNSGLPLSMFNAGLMQAFQKELDYKLIVLHYGTNILNYGSYNYSWYEKRMKKVISHLRMCFPNAEFLIISTADKATKYGLEMKTDSAVVPLLKAQRKYAMLSQSGFVNLYDKMGGEGSMVKWVEADTAKANKDYTHFNYRGSKMIGKLIFDQLDEAYKTYKKNNNSLSKIKALNTKNASQKKDTIYED